MKRSFTTLTAGLLLGTILMLAEAAPKPPWYLLSTGCAPAGVGMAPADQIRLVEAEGGRYKMVDVTESGEVVQTTMVYYFSSGNTMQITWVRGKERCEEARRRLQQQDEAREEAFRKKYQ